MKDICGRNVNPNDYVVISMKGKDDSDMRFGKVFSQDVNLWNQEVLKVLIYSERRRWNEKLKGYQNSPTTKMVERTKWDSVMIVDRSLIPSVQLTTIDRNFANHLLKAIQNG